MERDVDSKKFTYGNLNKFNRVILFLFSLICFAVGLTYIWGLISLLTGQESRLSLSSSQLFWYFIGFSIWSPLVYAFLSYLTTDIEVEDGGLRIKFLFKKLFIKWNDIDEFRLGRVFGVHMIKKASIVVTKNALTPLHRLYGLMYGNTRRPTLLIWSYIGNYDELVATIKKNLKNRKNK